MLEFIEIDLLSIVHLLLILVGQLWLTVRQHLFAVIVDGAIASIDPFLETIIKASLPNVDNLIRSTRNEVISLSAELSGV